MPDHAPAEPVTEVAPEVVSPTTTVASPEQQAWSEYEDWMFLKNKKLRRGTILVLVALAFRIAVEFLIPPLIDRNGALIILLIEWAFLAVHVIGAGMVCSAKGLSPVLGIFGLLVFLFPDKNRREAPNKPSTGYKPEGAVFSDW